MDVKIGTVEIAALIVGIVQTVKLYANSNGTQLSLKATMGVAMGVGAVLFTIFELLNLGYVTGEAAEIVEAIVRVVSWIVAVPGLFSVARDEIAANVARVARKGE
jgi:hypothetical protein